LVSVNYQRDVALCYKLLRMKKLALMASLLLWFGVIKAQHCRFDGSIVLVLDIRNKATNLPISNLDVRLVDKDSLSYYRTSWDDLAGYPIGKDSEYMRFTYISDKIYNELRKSYEHMLPKTVLHKYIIWAGPATYRNAFPLNLSKRLYLQDRAAINIMRDNLISKTKYIPFVDNVLFTGCTDGKLWKDDVVFQTVYFSDEEVKDFEKLKKQQ